jgi:hypothetical protein
MTFQFLTSFLSDSLKENDMHKFNFSNSLIISIAWGETISKLYNIIIQLLFYF